MWLRNENISPCIYIYTYKYMHTPARIFLSFWVLPRLYIKQIKEKNKGSRETKALILYL